MVYAVIGSRSFSDYGKMIKVLDKFLKQGDSIVSGGAVGADSLAKTYADFRNISIVEFLPDWNKHGKMAGFVRNREIINFCNFVIAFHDGISAGTAHSISLAKDQKKNTLIVYF